jgi:tetratricopeptide (TPR) repeat protein
MLALDDEEFRRLCEELDEQALSSDLPAVMMDSLDTIDEELSAREHATAPIASLERDYDDLTVDQLKELAFYHVDRGESLKGVEILEIALQKDENRSDIWLALADTWLIAAKFEDTEDITADTLEHASWLEIDEEIIKTRLRSIRMEYSDEMYVREIFCQCYLETASRLFKEDRFEEASQEYFHALRIIPGNYEVLLKLGCCLWRMGDREKAIRYFHQSLIIMEMPALVMN